MVGEGPHEDFGSKVLRSVHVEYFDTEIRMNPSSVTVVRTGEPAEHTWDASALVDLPIGTLHVNGDKKYAEISMFDDATVIKVSF